MFSKKPKFDRPSAAALGAVAVPPGNSKHWRRWTAEQHIDEAQRLAATNPALANVHATLAIQRTLKGGVAVANL